jgi:hypothetical protein
MISLPDDLQRLLDESPVPWRIETGGKHYKVYIADRMVTILPKSNNARNYTWRSHRNAMAHVKRAIKREQQR